MIENRLVGIKSREVYEAPAAALLYAAHGALESLTRRARPAAPQGRARAAVRRRWSTTASGSRRRRPRSTRSCATAQTVVTGEVRVRLYKGHAQVVGRRAPVSLYDHGLATYEEGDAFQHGAAAGFIHIWSLPTKTWAASQQTQKQPV